MILALGCIQKLLQGLFAGMNKKVDDYASSFFSELISQGNPNLRIGGEKSSQLETPIQENKLLQANKNSE
jgi:hypothetical protein